MEECPVRTQHADTTQSISHAKANHCQPVPCLLADAALLSSPLQFAYYTQRNFPPGQAPIPPPPPPPPPSPAPPPEFVQQRPLRRDITRDMLFVSTKAGYLDSRWGPRWGERRGARGERMAGARGAGEGGNDGQGGNSKGNAQGGCDADVGRCTESGVGAPA